MSIWQISYQGVTKSSDAWGISGLTRERKSAATDVVRFKLDGALIDTNPFPCLIGTVPANQLPLFTITRAGAPWFTGIVTKPKPKATPRSESIEYEVAGPWLFLEKTVFQQQWVTSAVNGNVLGTLTTTRSNTILGQSLDGTKMDSGEVLVEVLRYAQYAYQMKPFPAAVDVRHLPPKLATEGPYIIGKVTPNIVVPYSQVRDRSCADIVRLMMKYSPDAIAWFDYSTTPPTLNIDVRGNLPPRTIKVVTSNFPTDGYAVGRFSPEPRYDLVPPCVVLKFEEKNSLNGVVKDTLTVQVWPPAPDGVNADAWAQQPFALVQTIDLIGGAATTQSMDIKSVPRPVKQQDVIALNWALKKLPWLITGPGGTLLDFTLTNPYYDIKNIQVASVNTVIDPNDPLNDDNKNPNNITITADGNDCPQLVFELLTASFPDWLQDDPNNLDCAKVVVQVNLKYDTTTGSDAATKGLFWYNEADPTTPLTDGTGVLRIFYPCKVTNAATNTYSELTSWDAAEPVPTGMAKAIYESLAPLHFQGDLVITEQECSDLLPPGVVFNTTDGDDPRWKTMNALVLSVMEDVYHGRTSVQFGAPQTLDAEDGEAMIRAQLGRLPSYKLNQRTTGDLAAGSNVIGHRHSADTHVVTDSPPPTSVQAGPFTITFGANVSPPNTYWCQVALNGYFTNSDGTALTLQNPDGTNFVNGVSKKFNLDGNDTIWVEGTISPSAPPVVKIQSYGAGNSGLTNQFAFWTAGGLTEDDGNTPPAQKYFRKVVASFLARSGGAPTLGSRLTTTNLQICGTAPLGRGALYPLPS